MFIKDKDGTWKDKAKERRIENKRLNKRIKEIIESRDHWKRESERLKKEKEGLEERLKKKTKFMKG
jgi:hypothetical protein